MDYDALRGAAEGRAKPHRMPVEVNELKLPRELRPRGNARSEAWSFNGSFENTKRLAVSLFEKLDGADEAGMARVLWAVLDNYPHALLLEPLNSLLRQFQGLSGAIGADEVALGGITLIQSLPRGRGNPLARRAEVMDEYSLFEQLRELQDEWGSGKIASEVTASALSGERNPIGFETRDAREQVKVTRRSLRRGHLVPVLIAFPPEAIELDTCWDLVSEKWLENFVRRGVEQRGPEHQQIAWREGLVRWVLTAPTESRLRVICGDNWDDFFPEELPSKEPLFSTVATLPVDFDLDDDDAVRQLLDEAEARPTSSPRSQRVPPWFTEAKRAQMMERRTAEQG